MEVLLIRHGQTPGNKLYQYIGRTDQPLSEEGVRLAEAGGSLPCVEEVFVTPLMRTQQTAKICFPNARQVVVEGLREMDFGDFEGRSAKDMEFDPAYRDWVEKMCIPPCPNGESMEGFQKRVVAAFLALVRAEAAKGREKLAFVVHGGVIMALMSTFCNDGKQYFEFPVPNCGGYRGVFDLEKEVFSEYSFVEKLNGTEFP